MVSPPKFVAALAFVVFLDGDALEFQTRRATRETFGKENPVIRLAVGVSAGRAFEKLKRVVKRRLRLENNRECLRRVAGKFGFVEIAEDDKICVRVLL